MNPTEKVFYSWVHQSVGGIFFIIRATASVGFGESGHQKQCSVCLRLIRVVAAVKEIVMKEILPACRELGVGVTAYGVLARGLLSGHWSKDRVMTPGDFRKFGPRFSGTNLDHNLALVEALRAIAKTKDATVTQIAIAWVLSRGSDIVPLIGARRRDRLAEALGALKLDLTADDLSRIEQAVPLGAAAGDRYPAAGMATLDSERG
jgi:predicted oxidoreductase